MSSASAAGEFDWASTDLSGDPHIVLGRRSRGGITAARIDVHEDLHEQVREVCRDAIQKAGETTRRVYEPNAALEAGEEHFALTIQQLQQRVRSFRNLSPGRATSATDDLDEEMAMSPAAADAEGGEDPALIACLRNPVAHRLATRQEFQGFNPFFYAVCWQLRDRTWISFIRKTNPQQFFKVGRVFCQYADTLKRIDTQPTFALDPQVDVISHGDHLLSFSGSALNLLFTDIRLVQSGVPAHVDEISEAISDNMPLTEQSMQALVSAGVRLKSVAIRIYGLSTRLRELQESGTLTTERYREIAAGDEKALRLLGSDDQLDFDEAGAHTFLDVIEGRYFEDDWTGSPRRADRFSSRR